MHPKNLQENEIDFQEKEGFMISIMGKHKEIPSASNLTSSRYFSDNLNT